MDFMSFRFWIGVWITVQLLVIVIFDLSFLVRFITRFTEESFAVLISLIFIVEAFMKVAAIWKTHPIHLETTSENINQRCHCEHPPPGYWHEINGTNATMFAHGYDVKNASYQVMDHPIFETYNWSSLVSEDCITYEQRIVVGHGCVSEMECEAHGWLLKGDLCTRFSTVHGVPDVFLLSCFLFLGTFALAIFFRSLRTSSYFPQIVSFHFLLVTQLCDFDFSPLSQRILIQLFDYFFYND